MILAKRLFFHHDPPSERSVAVNCVSGAVDLLAIGLARSLEPYRGKRVPKNLLDSLGKDVDALRERRYLFDEPETEKECLLELQRRLRDIAPPLTKFVICPTCACNLGCTYCYEGGLTERKGVMSVEQLRAALDATDALKQRPEFGRCLYELFGGEPLLPSTRAIVAELLTQIDERGDTLAIVTNGTRVNDFLPMFLEHAGAVESLQITLDGPREIHDRRRLYRNGRGSFEEIVGAIDQLLEAGFFVRLRINVDRENLESLPELFTFMERKEWTDYRHFACDVAPVTYHTQFVKNDNVMEEHEIVRSVLEDIPHLLKPDNKCNFGMFRVLNHVTSVLEPRRDGLRILPTFTYCEATEGSVFVFGVDGAIYGCPDSIVNRKRAIGEFWPNYRLDEEKLNSWRRDIFSIPKCADCEIAPLCGGGCALVPMDRCDCEPDCNGAHETLHAYLDFWLRRRFPLQPKADSSKVT